MLRPPSGTLPFYEAAVDAEPNPWERNAGKFDQATSGTPAPDDASAPTAVPLEFAAVSSPEKPESEPDTPMAEAPPLVQVAVDLVQLLGLEGARRAVRAAAEASGETEAFRRPKGKSDHLRAIVERVEHLVGERDAITAEINEVLKFAKDIGFDPPAIRRVVKDREMDRDKRFTAEAIYTVYRHALGIEDPDFALELPAPSIPPPVKARKLTAKEKAYQETLASVAASRVILLQ
ncbi:DUF2312 domain-containing protein [Sphingomonas gellani]|uniref:DUF2312 domain-containing protein n=1 Tax=Sphingomonas gellani TaxID=1166340 RepID=UPI003138A6B8